MASKTYKIIRFFFQEDINQTLLTGLTLKEAQAHCRREDTHNPQDGWFDGYEEE
jgi:hypothetical protein